MNQTIRSVLYIFGFLLLFSGVSGQNLPELHFKILMNDTLNFELFSYTYPYEVAPFAQNGDLEYPSSSTSGNMYPIAYIPDQGFVGKDEFVFQYRGDPGSGYLTWAIKYTKVFVEVSTSVVTVESDNKVLELNAAQTQFDVLSNDSSTHGELSIDGLTNIAGGTASISADNKILFDVEQDFVGNAYLNYIAVDSVGTKGFGQLSIQVIDNSDTLETAEIWLATLNTKSLILLLPQNDYSLDADAEPEHGELEFVGDNQAVFTPDLDFSGVDSFALSNNDQERFYTIDIYDIPNDGLAVVDDEVYTLKNEAVNFNVLDNDYLENYMHDWTQPDHGYVNYLGDGEFSYMPDEDYNGYDEFEYTMRVAPIVFQTAIVRIGVDNFTPVNLEEFNINTSKNTAVVINYEVPIDNFDFDVLNDPSSGTLTVYEGYQTITIDCETISGLNLVVYEPDADFVGTDEFELDYCPGEDDCQLVKVHVEILDIVLDPDCSCIGDCVWKGDTNADGKVDVEDLLPIGLYMGEEGEARTADDPDEWLGLNSTNWSDEQVYIGKNLKHIDTDGNGLINAEDTSSISDNYNSFHTVVADGVKAFKEYPFEMITEQDTVAAGDWLHIVFSIGDESYPVIDLNGLSYGVQFPPELIDSASVSHEFFTDSWFANASSTLQMDKQPFEGNIEAAFTRVGKKGASGYGPIAKCDFIVEDDIEGLKLKSDIVPITFRLSGATGMDQFGGRMDLPEAQLTIYLNLRKKAVAPLTKELILYPNPARDFIIIHMNGKNMMSDLNVYTSTGVLMDRIHLDALANNTKLDLSKYNTGIYIIEVETPNGKTAQRFEVIK